MPPTPIQSPSGYAVSQAVAFADADGSARLVSIAAPLPVTLGVQTTAPLAGSAVVSGAVGPYQPVIGRPVMLALSGSWSGTVRLLRSTDQGATRLPLTAAGSPWGQFTANCCEAVWQEADATAQLYLDIALASGSLTYRLAQ